MREMKYPPEMIRGITNLSDDIVEVYEGEYYAKAGLFQFTDESREDGMLEVSINWYDDDGALTNVLEYRKGENIKYKGGAAIIQRGKFDSDFKRYVLAGAVSYERAKIDGNEYHGNILVSKTKIKNLKGIIQSTLAGMVDRFEKQSQTT